MRVGMGLGFLAVVATASAGGARADCAGLSAGSIASKFSEAVQSCGRNAAAIAAPRIVVVPQHFDLPTSVAVPFAAPRAARSGRRSSGVGTLMTVSRKYRIDPLLLHSIVAKESAYRPAAVSPKGALGLMQIMPGTARGLGVDDPSRLLVDQELNLVTGATYLKQLQGQFGNDVPAVLAAYNAGPGAVRRYRGTPPYAETRDYVKTIMKRYRSARGESLRR